MNPGGSQRLRTTRTRTTGTRDQITRRLRELAWMFDSEAVDAPTAELCKEHLRKAAQLRFVAYCVKSGTLSELHGQEWITAARMTYALTIETRKV